MPFAAQQIRGQQSNSSKQSTWPYHAGQGLCGGELEAGGAGKSRKSTLTPTKLPQGRSNESRELAGPAAGQLNYFKNIYALWTRRSDMIRAH
jgi:hypothetical protein